MDLRFLSAELPQAEIEHHKQYGPNYGNGIDQRGGYQTDQQIAKQHERNVESGDINLQPVSRVTTLLQFSG